MSNTGKAISSFVNNKTLPLMNSACCSPGVTAQFSWCMVTQININKKMPERKNTGKSFQNLPGLQAKLFAEITSAHGFSFYLASSGWLGRSVWFILTVVGAVLSVIFTIKISLSSFNAPFYSTDISIISGDTIMVSLPNIVVCDPSPWDFEKAESLNISISELSYIAHLLYPLNSGGNSQINFTEMDKEYQTLLRRFDHNPINLLNNVTRNCSQLVTFCQLGTNETYSGCECCPLLFSNVEYTLMYKCYSSGKTLAHQMWEPSQAFGITVSVKMASEKKQLNARIAGDWAIFMTGISAAVSDMKANLYYVTQTNLKLLEANTYNALPVEKKEIDSSDRSSHFQQYEERKKNKANF
jgi:hypothetical protein